MPLENDISDHSIMRYNFYKNPLNFREIPRSSPVLPFPVLKTHPHPPLWQTGSAGASQAQKPGTEVTGWDTLWRAYGTG